MKKKKKGAGEWFTLLLSLSMKKETFMNFPPNKKERKTGDDLVNVDRKGCLHSHFSQFLFSRFFSHFI